MSRPRDAFTAEARGLGREAYITAAGLATSLGTAAVVWLGIALFGVDLSSLSVWIVVPVGAVAAGAVAASGYYIGAVRTETKPSLQLLVNMVLIGASTGGPRALQELLTRLPAHFPLPVLIAQHMPGSFTRVFAERLAQESVLPVKEVNRPTPLVPGEILIARGDADVVVGRRSGCYMALSVPPDVRFRWHPSVERLVRSAMEHFPPEKLIAVQLTGMGDDGAEAMAQLHRLGGWTIAESEETAVVFGMPRELIERDGANVVLPVDRIAGQLVQWACHASYDGSRTPA